MNDPFALKPLHIYGAGSLGTQVMDLVKRYPEMGYRFEEFLVDEPYLGAARKAHPHDRVISAKGWRCNDWSNDYFFVAIANCQARKAAVERLSGAAVISRVGREESRFATLICPTAYVARDVHAVGAGPHVGPGTFIGPNVNVMPKVRIRSHVIVNVGAVIGDGSALEDFVTVNPLSMVTYGCLLRQGAFVGSGAVIDNQAEVGSWARIGANAVLRTDAAGRRLYVGAPAKLKRVGIA
jgi:carbonic anhydrase/acetyltransferase-like protein (isoleucine patch superfamily)